MPRGIYDRKAARDKRLSQSGKTEGQSEGKRKYTKRTPNLDEGPTTSTARTQTIQTRSQRPDAITFEFYTNYISQLVGIRAGLAQSPDNTQVFQNIVRNVESEIELALSALRRVTANVFSGGGNGGGSDEGRGREGRAEMRGDEPIHFNPVTHQNTGGWRSEPITQ